MRPAHIVSISTLVAMLVQSAAASAQAATTEEEVDNVFTLGEVQVTGDRLRAGTDDDRVTADEVWRFNTNSLTEAVKLVPGVTSSFTSNGRRNEGDISVRGFDRWRVPLAIDGIRVYLPADNRIDFNRFLTPDLAEVQVRKGRVSVLDGPGAMGGMVNLVTRKPTKAFESEVQGGASFDRGGSYDGWFGTAIVGTRMDKWYAQLSATEVKRDSWTLSKDFKPVGAAEDGGEREGSATEDWRVNLKTGFTPNDTDEYSLSFTRQAGEKLAPLGVDFFLPSPPAANPTTVNTARYQANNYWTWPSWDVQSAYWLSHTQFGDDTYVKTRLSYSEFDNALFAWDDINYNSQSAAGRFRSYYHDNSLGASVEGGTSFIADNITRAAFIFRKDRHREYNDNRPTNPSPALHTIEPYQHNEERTWSVALENTWAFDNDTDVIGGVSYDRNELTRAEEYGTPLAARGLQCRTGTTAPCIYDYAQGEADSFNWQTAFQHRFADSQIGLSVSSRTRFPNNFERFSTRFGTNIPNPDLASERATHIELSWQANLLEGAHVSAAVFYTNVKDLIQTVVVTPPNTTQTQNVGDGGFHGMELGGDYRLLPQLRLGANYSYLHRQINDELQPNVKPTGAPNHLGFIYAEWQPLPSLSVQPSFELAGNRWSDVNGSTTLGYQRVGRYSLVNLQASWQPIESVELVIGARNLLDRNFELAPGFPEPGRSLFSKVRWKF